MGLSEKDKLDFKKGMFEIHETLGSTSILYYPLGERTSSSIYGEKKGQTYLDPITLVGSIKFNTNDNYPFQDIGKSDVSMLIKIPILQFEELELNPDDLITGLFEVKGKKYNILNCNPTGLIADFFSTYEYQCKGVDIV